MAFQSILLALCSIYRLVPQLDDGISSCLGSSDPLLERSYLQSFMPAALFPMIETPGDFYSEKLAVLDCIGCALCISTSGAGIT